MLNLQIATFILYACAANYLNNYLYRKNFLRTIQSFNYQQHFDDRQGIKVIELVLSLMSEYFILPCTKCQGILRKEALIYKVFCYEGC